MRAASLTPPILKVRSLTLLLDDKTISSEAPNLQSLPKIETFYLHLGNDSDPTNLEAHGIIIAFFEDAERHGCQNKIREAETDSAQDYVNQTAW